MNKKKYIAVGIFTLMIVIGAGIAYYFDPAAINNFIGIDSAQIDAVSDGDMPAIDSTSSSFANPPADANVDPAAAGAPQAKITPVVQQENHSDDDAAAPSSLSGTSATVQSASDTLAVAISPSSCSFPTTPPSTTTHQIIVNEIAWMGSTTSSVAEWMEIKNISTSSIDLSGWQLSDISGKVKIIFSAGGALAAGGLQLLSRDSTTTSASATGSYSGDLVNTGDVLAIMDPQCNVSDYLDASHGWPGGNNTTKQTLERDVDGVGWHTSALSGGTPGAENSVGAIVTPTSTPTSTPQPQIEPPPTQPVPDDPIIVNASATSSDDADANATSSANVTSTIASPAPSSSPETVSDDGTAVSPDHIVIAAVQIGGASSSNDLVKLYNPTASVVDMSGWKLHKKSETGTDYSLKVLPAGSVIAPGQSFTWANSTDGFSEAVGADVSSTETLAGDNSVALMDAAGNVIDAVAWGTGIDQYGEGPPYPTSPGANQLLSRRSSGGAMVDTDNNTNDFTIQ